MVGAANGSGYRRGHCNHEIDDCLINSILRVPRTGGEESYNNYYVPLSLVKPVSCCPEPDTGRPASCGSELAGSVKTSCAVLISKSCLNTDALDSEIVCVASLYWVMATCVHPCEATCLVSKVEVV